MQGQVSKGRHSRLLLAKRTHIVTPAQATAAPEAAMLEGGQRPDGDVLHLGEG